MKMKKVKADIGYITKEEAARRLANFNDEDVTNLKVIRKYRSLVNNLIDKGFFRELPYKSGRIRQISIDEFENYLFNISKDQQPQFDFNKPPVPSVLAEMHAIFKLYEKDILTSHQTIKGIRHLLDEYDKFEEQRAK